MLKRVVVTTLAVALLAVPAVSQAAFSAFYPDDPTIGGTQAAGVAGVLVNVSTNTTIDLFFDTNSVDLSGFSATGVFGWGLTLTAGGDITLNNGVDTGGDTDGLSTCLSVSGTQTACSALDDGGGSASGIAGLGVAMFSIDVLGSVIGAQLIATTADFTEGDFSTTSAAPRVLATIVPEPNALVLLGASLAGLSFLRRRRA